jgi:hypothetical protein
MQTNVIQYNHYSADKKNLVMYTGWHIDSASYWYGRQNATWKLLHSTAQSRNIQTEFSKAWVDGAAITTEENCSRDDRGLRFVF